MAAGKETRRNEEITAPQVRVIDAEGEQAGVMSIGAALSLAEQGGLDLVEIAPNGEPPVCRIMDYGKYRFEQQKKSQSAKKKQKQVQVKEVKFRPSTEIADYQVKLRSVRRFLEEGDKVKITLRFRGREMAHQELGTVMLKRVEADLANEIVIEQFPRIEGRQMVMMISSKKS
ncbi:MAG TPA: translation initiation factor IF-3 [Xanthomonadales bacterium]|nr:translation initiation factor IF-3 [Xanthomonadales bacterium]